MLEMGSSGLTSGEEKRAAASRPRTALFLDSMPTSAYLLGTAKTRKNEFLSLRWRSNDRLPTGAARHIRCF